MPTILLDIDGITDATLRLPVCATVLVAVTIAFVTASDDKRDTLLDSRFNVDEGVIKLLSAETPTMLVEDVSATAEPTTWLCVSLAWVGMEMVCVNVTEGNPDCILEALAKSNVILGVVDVDKAAL